MENFLNGFIHQYNGCVGEEDEGYNHRKVLRNEELYKGDLKGFVTL